MRRAGIGAGGGLSAGRPFFCRLLDWQENKVIYPGVGIQNHTDTVRRSFASVLMEQALYCQRRLFACEVKRFAASQQSVTLLFHESALIEREPA
jgi:hypothetical protein